MLQYSSLNEGTYFVQSGYRNHTAIIECPYVSHKIEVYGAQELKILHGAQVFWTQIRRQYPSKRKGNREVISAAVVGIKHCPYLCQGKNILCTLKVETQEGRFRISGMPVNRKLPAFQIIDSPQLEALNLSSSDLLEKYQHIYCWAQLMFWNYGEELPRGRITGTFSEQYKTPEVESQVLLHNLEISEKRSTLMSPQLIQSKDYLPIKDHRQFNSMVFTIDPEHCIDMEDGLSVEQLGEDLYEVGVHISDVTAYSHLINRHQIASKGTSIYLPHKTIHMMPPELIDLLALKSRKRRLAFSAFIKVRGDGQILQSRFEKTVVTSSAQLSYQEAQDVLDGITFDQRIMKKKELTENEMGTLREKLLVLRKIARGRREGRSSCEMFDKNEVVFQLNSRGVPINIGLKKRMQSEKIVQQFMILTNYEVAKKLVSDFGANSLIIYHPKPLDCNMEHLNGYMSDLGVKFKADNMMHLEKEFKRLFEKEALDDSVKQLLLYKAINIQEHAVYTRYLNLYKGHFGLSLDSYTHFTSPLRRFADQIVHEQLDKCINNQPLKKNDILRLEEELGMINRARATNKKLKQLVIECFINLYLYHCRQTIRTKGFILRLGLRSATIYVPQYNLIKEVAWTGNTVYTQTNRVELVVRQGNHKIVRQFQKNDPLDIEIKWEKHQEVQMSIVINHEGQILKL